MKFNTEFELFTNKVQSLQNIEDSDKTYKFLFIAMLLILPESQIFK